MRRFILAAFVALFLAGCVTPPVVNPSGDGPAISAFRYYRENAENINHNTVVAMLSYTAAGIYRTRHNTWEGYEAYFNDLVRTMKNTGQVSSNYPVKVTAREIGVYHVFCTQWINNQRWNNVSPIDAKESYPAHAAALITRINDYEYRK